MHKLSFVELLVHIDNRMNPLVYNYNLTCLYTLGYYDVVTIPTGARHIMVYEDPSTTDNFIGELSSLQL